MGKLVPFQSSRRLGPALEYPSPPAPIDAERELVPVALLLFVASLARVLRALWTHEAFTTEPTLALLLVTCLPWLTLRWARKRD